MNLIYGVSQISDGNMSVKWGVEKEVIENRRRFLGKLGIEYGSCVTASLRQRDGVAVASSVDKGRSIECDALVTEDADVALWMVTADCYPVVLHEPSRAILALVHLGRPGVDIRLGQKVVTKMETMGAAAAKMEVFVAPGIGKESYKWRGELPVEDPEWKDFTEMDSDGFWHLDEPGFIKKQLTDKGIKPENIKFSGIDVFKDSNYYSHVRSWMTGEKEGRFATVVMMK